MDGTGELADAAESSGSPGAGTVPIASEEKDGLVLEGPLDRVNFKFEIRDAIHQSVVGFTDQ